MFCLQCRVVLWGGVEAPTSPVLAVAQVCATPAKVYRVSHGANIHGQTSLPGERIKFSIPATTVTQYQKSVVAGIVFRV